MLSDWLIGCMVFLVSYAYAAPTGVNAILWYILGVYVTADPV